MATCIASFGLMAVAPTLAGASTYSSAVVSDGASNYWRFDVPYPVDQIGGWNGGDFGSSVDSGAITGDSNNSVLLHGPTSDWVYAGDPGCSPPTPLSTELWFKTATVEDQSVLFDRHWGGMEMWLHSGHVHAVAHTTLGDVAVESPSTYANGSWHYAVMTADGSTFKLYVDAALVAIGGQPSPLAYRTDCIYGEIGFGSHWNGGGDSTHPTSLPGDLDEVAFYPTALSAGTIRTHYSDAGYTPPPLATPLTTMEPGGGCNKGEAHVCQAHRYTRKPVDTATGNFFHTFGDLSIPGRGQALDFSRTYNAYPGLTVPDGPLGYGWTATYTSSLNVAGSTVTVINDDGAQTQFTYSGGVVTQAGQVTGVLVNNGDGTWTYSPDHRLSYRYDGTTGHLLSITDPNGYVTSLSYNGSGQLSAVTDPASRTFTFTWTGTHITGLADSTGRSLTYEYNDGNGNLTDVIDVLGGHSQFSYDANHRLLTMRSPRFYGDTTTTPTPVTTNVYDASGRVTSQTDPVGNVTLFDYTTLASSGGTIVTDPNGNETADYYNSYGLLTKETRGYGTAQAADWLYTYDPYTDGVATVEDPNLNVTSYVYDPNGNVLEMTNALSHTTYYSYDGFNDLTSITDPNGTTTTSAYDANGNLATTSAPCLNPDTSSCGTQTTHYYYTDSSHPGDVTSMTDPRGKTTSFGYDSHGDRNSVTDPLSNQTTNCFDSAGRETATISPIGVAGGVTCASTPPAAHTTYFTYDNANGLLTSTDPLGHETIQTYDADHNLQTVEDPDTNVTTYHYDPAEELKTVDRADGTHLNYTYDGDGNQLTYADGATNTTTYAYNDRALPNAATSSTPPAVGGSHTTAYAYDGAGNLATKQDPGGNCSATPKTGCTTYAYDDANQLTSITYSDGTTPNVSNIAYDPDGQRTAMTDGTGTSSWAWDSLHRLTSTTNGAGRTINYGYDLNGDQTTITYPGDYGGTVTRGFDDDSRLHTVTDWQSTPNVTTFNYNADSVITSEVYPNGTTATFTPDGADRLSSISDAPTSSPGSPYATFGYTRDSADQVTGVTPTGVGQSSQSYGYTALNQLHSTNSVNYSYDSADNLTATPAGTKLAYDNANELCWTATSTASCASPPSGATTYSYNSLGERTAMTPPTGNPGVTYGYDQAQRLASLSGAEYRTDVLASKPFAYWRLGEASGTTANDSSGNVHNGTTTSVTWGASSALTTDANKAATFNGTSSYVDAGTLSGVVTSNFSEEAWIKTSTATGTPYFLAVGSTTSITPYIGLSVDATTGVAAFNVRDVTNSASTVLGSKVVDDGAWHHIVGTRASNGDMHLYVDGRYDGSTQGPSGAVPIDTASVGALKRTLVNHGLNGSIDEAAIYPSVLSPAQANSHYWAGKSNYAGTVTADAPTALWRLGETSGTTATDATFYINNGSTHNGTYVGGTGVTYNVSGALTGDSDKAVAFNGSSAYMWSPTAVSGTTAFTEEAWVKTTTSAAGAYIVGAASSASNTPITGIDTSSTGGKANFVIRDDNNATFAVAGTTTINNGAWHHIVGVRNGSTMTLYVDGKVDATGSISSTSSVSLNTTTVGALKRGTNIMYYLNGTVDEAAIYPVALDAQTVARHYHNGTTATPAVATYTYNGDGLRTTKTIAGVTTNYTWDPTSDVPLLTNDGTTNYIYGPNDQPIEQSTGSTVIYYQQDGQGSTRVLTDQTGNVVATYSTDAYGNPAASTGSAQTPLRYDGEYRDNETGFVYLRDRSYDPATSQYLSRDPAVSVTASAYAYVGSDPLNATDPLGLCKKHKNFFGWVRDKTCETGDAINHAASTVKHVEHAAGAAFEHAGDVAQVGSDIAGVGAAIDALPAGPEASLFAAAPFALASGFSGGVAVLGAAMQGKWTDVGDRLTLSLLTGGAGGFLENPIYVNAAVDAFSYFFNGLRGTTGTAAYAADGLVEVCSQSKVSG